MRPILELSDVQKRYQNVSLWQFFAMRIPSLEQPEIKEIFIREHISDDDGVKLLQRFGKRSIANPYELMAA